MLRHLEGKNYSEDGRKDSVENFSRASILFEKLDFNTCLPIVFFFLDFVFFSLSNLPLDLFLLHVYHSVGGNVQGRVI